MTDHHLSADELAALAHGELDGDLAERLLAHVESCSPCLDQAEQLLAETGISLPPVPDPSADTRHEIGDRLRWRVHGTGLAEDFTVLGSRGFLLVVLGLLRPLLALFPATDGNRRPR